jgi:hypothetical protein
MKLRTTILLMVLFLLLTACQKATPVCPPVTGTPHYLTTLPGELATPMPPAGSAQVQMGRKAIPVDKIVEGPLCNDTWSGTVYVACNVQVYAWQEQPTFLKDCALNIAPDTVVYVAYHNNTAYYNGCSCHMGLTPEP